MGRAPRLEGVAVGMNGGSGDFARGTAVVLFLTMALAWGLNYLFVVVGLTDATPLWLAALRAGFGLLGVAVFLVVVQRGSYLDRASKRDAILIGLPNTAMFFGLWFVAASQVPAGETAIIVYTFPLWVALFSPWFLGHRLTGRHWAAISLGFLGIVLISQPWALGAGAISPLALVELLAAAISWALGTVLFQRRFRSPLEMREANLYQLIGGTSALLVAALLIDPHQLPQSSATLWVAVAWVGLFGTAYAYVAWYYLLARLPAATIAAYTFVVPLIALVAASIFFGESFSVAEFAGMGLVIISIYAIATARRPPSAPVAGRPADIETPAGPGA